MSQNKSPLPFEKRSLSTQVFTVLCICMLLSGILGILVYYNSSLRPTNSADAWNMFFSNLLHLRPLKAIGSLLALFPYRSFVFAGVCLFLSITGYFVDKANGCAYRTKPYSDSFDTLSILSVVIAILTAIFLVPKINLRMMLDEYGHDMGIMTDYWEQDGSLYASLQKISMFILIPAWTIGCMRQWIHISPCFDDASTRFVVLLVLAPVYVFAAIILGYCMSSFLASIIMGSIIFGFFSLFGIFGENLNKEKTTTAADHAINYPKNISDISAMEHLTREELEYIVNHPSRYSSYAYYEARDRLQEMDE